MGTTPTVRCALADQAGLLSDCEHQEYTNRLPMLCAAAGKPRAAWELYLRQGVSDKSLLLLQLIANQCYQQVGQDMLRDADISFSQEAYRSCPSGIPLDLADRMMHRLL